MEVMLLDLISRLNYELGINGNIAVDFQVKYIGTNVDNKEDIPEDGIYDSELVDIKRTGSSLKIIVLFED